jgi:hypothetical protein
LIGLDQVRVHLARVVSGLDDRYGPAGSPLTGRRLSTLRLRDQSGSLSMVDVLASAEPVVVRLSRPGDGSAEGDGSAVPAALPGGFRMRTVHVTLDGAAFVPGVSTILVRPDGYIAWAGDDETELSRAIGDWFGAAESAR